MRSINFVYGNKEEGVPGCVANGISEEIANKIYDEMIDFAKYAFNKSHAAAYAVVAYQTAYLKYYYPVEFMAALMTSVIDNPGKVSEYIYASRQMGIHILPPDINEGEGNFSVDNGNIRYGLTAIKSIGRPVIDAIIHEREMGIHILPPDINEGEGNFSVDNGNIRYGLTAIKSIGRPVIDAIIHEREIGGKYKNLKDFIERLSGKEVNKRTIENFIKAGAFDSLPGTRKQLMMIYIQILDQVNKDRKYSMSGQMSLFDLENFIKAGAFDSLPGTRKQLMMIYIQILDQVNKDRKYSMSGQMSLFDLVDEEQKKEFDIPLPDVKEYEKETMLAFEKEVLGVYVTGHPMEEYETLWKKNISATTMDFQPSEEMAFEKEVLGVYVTGHPMEEYETLWKKNISATTMDFQPSEENGRSKVRDGAKEIIGGLIVNKTIKYTKTNKVMAFLTIEDLLGTVEVVIFPKDYEKNKLYLEEDSKVFVKGRVSEEDERASKLICESIVSFQEMKKELWIQFPDKQNFIQEEEQLYRMINGSEGNDTVVIYCQAEKEEEQLYRMINGSEGNDTVVIYCQAEKAIKRLPMNRNVGIDSVLLSRLTNYFGEKRVKVVEKAIEKTI